MFESFNSKIKELWATNQDLQTYIDSFNNESKSRAAYPEQNNAHLNNVANITVGSDSTTSHNKQNGREEDFQSDHQTIFDKNNANESIIACKKIEPNAS